MLSFWTFMILRILENVNIESTKLFSGKHSFNTNKNH